MMLHARIGSRPSARARASSAGDAAPGFTQSSAGLRSAIASRSGSPTDAGTYIDTRSIRPGTSVTLR